VEDLELSGDPSDPHQDEEVGVTPAANKTLDFSVQESAGAPLKPRVIDYSKDQPPGPPPPPQGTSEPYNPEQTRETTRGDLARGLLWLLTFAIGGVLVFIGLGRLDGTVLTQSIFPSLVALAGTALGFYFGSQTAKESAKQSTDSTGDEGNGGSPSGKSGGRPGNPDGATQQNAGG
jgi:hypothetical protein